jgi:hypothetical protein
MEIMGREMGLLVSYGHDIDLFNLVSRTCSAMFTYEQGFEFLPPLNRIIAVVNQHLLEEALEQEISGKSLRYILQTTTPLEMYKLFVAKQPTHLKIAKLYTTGRGDKEDWNFLVSSMYFRQLQHRHWWRGRLRQQQNVVYCQFRSDLGQAELAEYSEFIPQLQRSFRSLL